MLCLLSFISCAALFRYFPTYNAGMMIMICIVGAFDGACFGWLPLYLPELFPNACRATGQGMAYNIWAHLNGCCRGDLGRKIGRLVS